VRRSLRLRLLGLSLAVASFAVVAMALLATYGTGSQLREELESDTSLLETDSEIRTALLAYADDHGGWDGVDRLVSDLAERTGRRIALTTPGGETIADSADLLGQGSSDLPSVPTARIDATRTLPSTARIDGRPGQVVELLGTVHLQGWRLTPEEESRRRSLADGAEACLAGEGVDATIAVDGATHVLARGTDAAGDPIDGARSVPDLRDHPCIPDEIYAPSAAAVELNGETVELITACLDDHGLAHEIATDTFGLEVVQPVEAAGTPPEWTDCVESGRVAAKRPYVAPAADLYLGTSDRFDPFSRDGWRRTAATTLAVLVAAALVTILAGRRLVRPITALTAAAQRMEAGDHSARVPGRASAGRPARSGDEITRLGQAFNAMAESVETHDRQRKALVNDVAHELRTPLANVRSHLEAAEDGVVDLDLDLIRSLHEESELLERLVADLHDLALADAGMLRIHPEERDAADIAGQAVAAHRARAEAAGLGLTLRVDPSGGGPVPVLADPGRLRQALGNLVSNATTHTPAGGTVTVGVAASPGTVVLTVTDTGPGIAAEHLPHVFDRFYRADPSRSRTTGGSGLGLAITKHLAEAHGGRIDVASAPGEGTTFTLRLPAPPR
jgi:two-component system sensor histidine kinase BaeS